jgi:hypothetical protein
MPMSTHHLVLVNQYCIVTSSRKKGKGIDRFNIDRSSAVVVVDMLKGSTDTPKEATPNKMMETLEPPML